MDFGHSTHLVAKNPKTKSLVGKKKALARVKCGKFNFASDFVHILITAAFVYGAPLQQLTMFVFFLPRIVPFDATRNVQNGTLPESHHYGARVNHPQHCGPARGGWVSARAS